MIVGMARAATTADAFNAVAEPRRRAILDVLAGGERPVNDLVRELGVAQPQVSKHLRVLREVGAVEVRGEGRQRLYSLNGQALKPIHDWVKTYEATWSERFALLDDVLDELKEGGGMTATVTPAHGGAVPDHARVRRAAAPRLPRVDDAGAGAAVVERARGEMTVADIDLRVGGTWRYVMIAQGGFEVAFHGEYREIVPNERIVNTEIFEAVRRRRRARRRHVPRGRWAHEARAARRVRQPRGARHDHGDRHGGRDAGADGSARGAADGTSRRRRAVVTGVDRREFLLATAVPLLARRLPELPSRAPLALVTADTEAHVVVVSLAGRVLRRVPTLEGPRSIQSGPGGMAIAGHTAAGAVTLLEGRPPRVRRVLRGFGEPRYTAFAPDGRHAFVTDSGHGEVAVIDVARGRVIRRVRSGRSRAT